MIAIIDYGMGNLRSVQKSLEAAGARTRIVSSAKDLYSADKVVLPGVGAMKPAMDRLEELGLIEPIRSYVSSGKPFLGICLGFQLLFDRSSEGGDVQGLGIISGDVRRFPNTVKVPQIGWNNLLLPNDASCMFQKMKNDLFVYFCHSYYVVPKDETLISAWAQYGLRYAAAIQRENLWGVQFHPEKSQGAGAVLLKNFVEIL